MPVLEIRGLTKKFGATAAVDGLDLKVEPGSVFGFIGLNGAGKTTTIRMVTGLLKPTEGEIRICGERVRYGSSLTNKHVGYLPDVPEFYNFLKPGEYLRLCGRLCGMESREAGRKSAELLGLVGLENANRKIGGFSRGMKQRLGIAQAMMHSPELLILDEPTSALDPVGRREILGILFELRGRISVLFSTHILADVQRVCDTVGILNRGKLALCGSLKEIEERFGGEKILIETGVPERTGELAARLRELKGVRKAEPDGGGRVMATLSETELFSKEICPLLSGLGLPLIRFEHLEPSLEDVFVGVISHE